MGSKILDRSKLDAAYVGFNTVFNEALGLAPNMWQEIATRIDSSNASEEYKWIGEDPLMKEWLGDREISQLRAQSYAIVNKRWANGIEVDRDDIADDNLGLVRPRIQNMAVSARDHYDELIFDILLNGFDDTFGLAHDGQFFFDIDHADEPGQASQINKTNELLDEAALNLGIQRMAEYKTPNGRPLNVRATHLLVGYSNRVTAKNLLKERLDSGADNVNAGVVELMLSPRIAGADAGKWFLLDLSKPLRPFILQIREDLDFTALDDPTDHNAFMRNSYMYGVDGRHNVGFGPWFCAYGSDATE